MIVNPSINIGLGDYGKSYINSFYDFTLHREKSLFKYMSFYHIISKDEGFEYYDMINKFKSIHDSIEELSKVIDKSYNDNVSLIKKRNTNVNFNSVNINLIVSYTDQKAINLLFSVVKYINESYQQMSFRSINLKVIGTIYEKKKSSKGDEKTFDLSRSLDSLKQLKGDYEVLSNFILLDDKNTKAEYLGVYNKSLGFLINEFITYFMTNHYKLLGNFISPDFISIGLGLSYFDIEYAKKCFKSFLSKQYLESQKIQDKSYLISVSDYFNIKNEYLDDLLINNISQNKILKFKELIKKDDFPLNKSETLKDGKFVLSHLIGKHNDVKLQEMKSYHNFISIKEIIIRLLNKTFQKIEEYEFIDIDGLKSKKDELTILNQIISNSEDPSQETTEKIQELENEIKEIEEKIEIYFLKFKDVSQYELFFEKAFKQKQNEINQLKDEKLKLENELNRMGFFKRLRIKSSFKNKVQNIENQVIHKTNNITEYSKETKNVKLYLAELYTCFEILEKKYFSINEIMENLNDSTKNFYNELNSMHELNYMFILNLFSSQGLKKYIENHKEELLKPFVKLKDLSLMDENRFVKEFEQIVEKKSNEVIKFSMIDYLEGAYDSIDFVRNIDIDSIDKFLQDSSFGFINLTNEYQNSSSHRLMVCCTEEKQQKVNKIDDLFSSYYTTGVPQKIDISMPYKLGLINIEIIEELSYIVKYS